MPMKFGPTEAGFDLSDIKVEKFQLFLDMFNLKYEGKASLENPIHTELDGFVWANPDNGNRIVTANNPITGEYYNSLMREKEIGYASYVGLSGDDVFIWAAFKKFSEFAHYIKNKEFGVRSYI